MMFNKRLINMVPEAKKYVLLKTLASWISLVAGIVLWFQVTHMLEDRLFGSVNRHIAALVVIFICMILRFALARLASSWTHKACAAVKTCLRSNIYEKLTRLGAGYNDYIPSSEIVQLAGEGVEQLESYFGNYLPQFFYAMLAPLTLFVVFVGISPLTAIVLLLCVPMIPVAIVAVMKVAKRILGKYWDAYANLGDSFLENIQGLTTLKVYSADEDRHKKMNEESEHFRIVTMKVLTMQLNSVTIMDFVSYGGTALGVFLSARAFMNESVTFGQALAMIMLASEFFLAMRRLGSYFHTAMNGMTSSERIFKLLDIPEEEDGTEVIKPGDIEIRGLSYSYNDESEALHDVNLTIRKGTITAVVGQSGCGKSTVASVLGGIRRNYNGSVTISGTELKEASSQSLYQSITVVPTSSYIFSGTVRDTLLEGKPNATDEEMRAILQKTDLLSMIGDHGDLDMVLTENGSNISGGQRQRLALARAILKDSPIYVFDEATSNIDVESEKVIMDAIYDLKGEHTIVLISHRLANVVGADEIFYLEKGQLMEHGIHGELLAQNSGYAKMFNAQRELEALSKGGTV